MYRIVTSLVALTIATASFAETQIEPAGIQAITYGDGVLFESTDSSAQYQLTVSGAGYQKSLTTNGYHFLDATSDDGGPLQDGLYKYEVREIPKLTISREESSKLADRNVLNGKTGPKASAVSGSFRVLNGQVVDATLQEDTAKDEQGDT